MKTSIIYNSYSGNTRSVAEKVHAACGGNLIEVKSNEYSSRLTAYTIGCYRAMKGICDPIEPATIDVAADDLIVIGTRGLSAVRGFLMGSVSNQVAQHSKVPVVVVP